MNKTSPLYIITKTNNKTIDIIQQNEIIEFYFGNILNISYEYQTHPLQYHISKCMH